MSVYAESYEDKLPFSAYSSIENLLETLNTRRLKLEDTWNQRRVKLEQCIQICFLRNEIKKVNKTKNVTIKI